MRYYRTAAEAAQFGFRPCLRCRPESAPFSPAWQGTSTTVKRALELIQAGALNQQNMREFSSRLGVGERYLRKLFAQQLGVSPAAIANTRRLHFARTLIAETQMGMADIACASGYGSLRRFNSAIRTAFDRNPSQMRRAGTGHIKTRQGLVLELHYRPPLDWDGLLNFFSRHSIDTLEGVAGNSYWRNLGIHQESCKISVTPHPQKPLLLLSLEPSNRQSLMQLVAKVRRMFDLDANPGDIGDVLKQSELIKPLWRRCQGVRSPVYASVFESCVRGLVGQQISLAAARAVCCRLVKECSTPGREATAFPSPAALRSLPDSALPMPNARKATLRLVCEYFIDLEDEAAFDPDALLQLKGIGPWTVAMVNMRGIGDPDSFPDRDLGLIKASAARGIADEKALNKALDVCQPWRSYAANLLWRSLP